MSGFGASTARLSTARLSTARQDSERGVVLNGGIGRPLLNVREAAQYPGLEVDTVYNKPGCGSGVSPQPCGSRKDAPLMCPVWQ
jgi:hypothetical protein